MSESTKNIEKQMECQMLLELLLSAASFTFPETKKTLRWLRQSNCGRSFNNTEQFESEYSNNNKKTKNLTSINNLKEWLMEFGNNPTKWYLLKPMNRKHLIETVKRHLSGLKSAPNAICIGTYQLSGVSRKMPSASVVITFPPNYDPEDINNPVAITVKLGNFEISAQTLIDEIDQAIIDLIRAQQDVI